jgi:multiple antibiotic resistance protein
MESFLETTLFMFVLLNPFIMSVYLEDLIKGMDPAAFNRNLLRAAVMSLVVFLLFAWGGMQVFEEVFQVRFESFLIFGGIIFLIVGARLILGAGPPVQSLDPNREGVSAAIAMPFIIGPGTISASVLAGSQLPPMLAVASITLALGAAVLALVFIKWLHDHVRTRNEALIQRYTEVAGRATALFIGTFAIEMILDGFERWRAATGTVGAG